MGVKKNNKNTLYGLLSYDTENIGDEIQSLAAKNFLPRIDILLNRENLNEVKSNKRIKLILNGWFMERPRNWPPSSDIDPLFISFHVAKKMIRKISSKKSIEYLKKHEPIGCRDYSTKYLLNKLGVKAYFSGCLTLTLQNKILKKSDKIFLVDLNLAGIKKKDLPKELIENSEILSHYPFTPIFKIDKIIKLRYFIKASFEPIYKLMDILKINWTIDKISGHVGGSYKKRFAMAKRHLKRYSEAKLVITSRIHCALPCLALGTPVIFVHKNMEDPRFFGLKDYFRSYTPEEFKKNVYNIDWKNPPKNPKSIKKLRTKLEKTVQNFIDN